MIVQEPLLNLLLCNLYGQAEKLRSKEPRFEAHSKQQLTMVLRRKLYAAVLTEFLSFTLILGFELPGRLFAYLPKFFCYLFYLGKIRTIQLQYTDAKNPSCSCSESPCCCTWFSSSM